MSQPAEPKTAAPVETPDSPETPAAPNNRQKVVRIIGAIAVIAAVSFLVHNFIYGRNHQATDDAQVSGDLVLVSPQVAGTISEILVDDNAHVKKGDVLVRLDQEKLKAAYAQAKANYEAALVDAKTAGVSIDYAAATAKATQLTASGSLQESNAGIASAQSAAAAADANQKGLTAQVSVASSNLKLAQVEKDVAAKSVQSAQAQVDSQNSQLSLAQAGVQQAQASLASAQAAHDLTVQNLTRSQNLYKAGAVSKATLDSDVAAEATAKQAVVAAQSQVTAAQAKVSQAKADLTNAQSMLEKARLGLQQSDAHIASAQAGLQNAKDTSNAAKLQAAAAHANIAAAEAKSVSSQGNVANSQAQNLSVQKLQVAQKQALAKVDQAKAAMDAAEIDLQHAVIVAPCDGLVSKGSIQVGTYVNVGTAMLYIVTADSLSVTANFKETQIADMNNGDEVDIDIDSFPGHVFHGKVDSLSPATGASTALLPPDNATGNFVKVVQRVPVKVDLDPDPLLDKLRVGLSANVTVTTK